MKRIITWTAAALAAAVIIMPTQVCALSAEKAIVIDANSGRVLLEKNADNRALIASTTKIMTALIICEQCNVLDRMAIPKEAVGIEGSSMYLREGEVVTIQDLLYGLMLRSGNDAATALAIYCGGTVEGFAQMMNDKAHKLELVNTHFENPHGLDSPNHYSTARDMACLTAYAMQNPIFAQTVSTKKVVSADRTLQNHNKLLWRLEGADGVKTGFTKAAGRILVSSATRNGRRLIGVTMNAPDDWNDHVSMIENGFQNYNWMRIVSVGECVGTKNVVGGLTKSVKLITSEKFDYSISSDEKVAFYFGGNHFVYAPISRGEFAGYLYLCINEKVIGKVPLVYGESVDEEKSDQFSIWDKIFGRR